MNIRFTVLLSFLSALLAGCSSQSTSPYNWKQTETSTALLNGDTVVWQLNYDKAIDKPYFHPVSLTDGTVLTELMPPDHYWHRGLWWSWKTINGLNYWEEDKGTHLSPGRNEITQVKVKTHSDGTAEANLQISYHPPGKPPVLIEKRTLKISCPCEKGIYAIDWQSVFTAQDKDVLLDRTPVLGQPNGVAWGGYAGLSIRLADSGTNWQAVDSEGTQFTQEFNASKANWCDYTIQTASGKPAGIAVLDHPDNLRHPTPWYVILGEGMKYFSPALIYYEPYTLKAGQSLTLKYRILVHPGRTDTQWLDNKYKQFSTD